MKPGRLYTLRALVRIVRLVRPAAIERWRTSKPMSDPKALAAADIMTAAVSVVLHARAELSSAGHSVEAQGAALLRARPRHRDRRGRSPMGSAADLGRPKGAAFGNERDGRRPCGLPRGRLQGVLRRQEPSI
ncbi:MAG: hypothetical protein HC923_05365 [Myxococcales bacterium]|nr:hypothetical protein [Myxococcales bacterium]